MPSPDLKLTRSNATDIIAKRRTARIEEIEWLLAHANDPQLQLSSAEQFELRTLAARLQSDRTCGQASQQSEKFVVQVIGTYRTPYGDLNRSDVAQLESIHTSAERAIAACRKHDSERCVCWREAREQLFELRRTAGDKSPLGLAALAVWNTIESLARDRKIEPSSEVS